MSALPPAKPSLGRVTVRAGAWTIGWGLLSRALGAIGTLLITHYVGIDDFGEVSAATVLVMTFNQFSTLGTGPYLIAHRELAPQGVFQVAAVHIGLGLLSYLVLLGGGFAFMDDLGGENVFRYVPGLCLALMLLRIAFIPDRLLFRDMRIGTLTVINGVSELLYIGSSVGLAMAGWGGMAIVAANIVRSAFRLVCFQFVVPLRQWATPGRWDRAILRDILKFGFAVWIGGVAAFALRRWDNLVVGYLWGASVLGAYTLAYNLADIPAVQIGEQISDVLQAALARAGAGSRVDALLRATQLLALIMTPMAVGLAVVGPTVTSAFLNEKWAGVGSMLFWLAVISFPRPISGTVGGYLQIRMAPRLNSLLEVANLVLLMAALWTLGQISPDWACIAVGLAFLMRLPFTALLLKRFEGVPMRRFLWPLVPPTFCALLMALVVYGTRVALLAPLHLPVAVQLACEVVVGAVSYVVFALFIARDAARSFFGLLRSGFARRAAAHKE